MLEPAASVAAQAVSLHDVVIGISQYTCNAGKRTKVSSPLKGTGPLASLRRHHHLALLLQGLDFKVDPADVATFFNEGFDRAAQLKAYSWVSPHASLEIPLNDISTAGHH